MIQEGRIIEGKLAYTCERCGSAISSGRYCRNCQEEVLDSFKPSEEAKAEPEGGKGMYISEFINGK